MTRPLFCLALVALLGCGRTTLVTVGDPPPDTADAGEPTPVRDAGTPPAPATCGDGKLDPGEECDWGGGNAPGAGCELDCKFSCSKNPDSCAQGDVCQGTSVCTPVDGPGGGAGQKCVSGGPLAACSACGQGRICVAGACAASVCGDGCLDVARGEQCDDGNTTNLDGCDSTCHLEQEQRAISLQIQYGTDGVCTANVIGASIGTGLQAAVQAGIDGMVNDGTVTLAYEFLGLADPTGAGTQSLQIGWLGGTPYAAPSGLQYQGNSDLDWWYTTDPADIDGQRDPLAILAATLDSGQLRAGPGTLRVALAASVAEIDFSSVRLSAHLGGATAPTASQGDTPGHLPSEHVDPALLAIASTSEGELCGDAIARSMSRLLLPPSISQAYCAEKYTEANSVLDLFVRGCTQYGVIPVLKATQPDRENPNKPPAGAGGPYRLSWTSNGIVDQCADKTGAGVDLYQCLDAAAFSTFFKLATDRVIMK